MKVNELQEKLRDEVDIKVDDRELRKALLCKGIGEDSRELIDKIRTVIFNEDEKIETKEFIDMTANLLTFIVLLVDECGLELETVTDYAVMSFENATISLKESE